MAAIVLTPIDGRTLTHVRREIYSRGFVYAIRDRWSERVLVTQRLRAAATHMNKDACQQDRVSAAQLYEHAARRVGGLLKHRWTVERYHLDDEAALATLASLRQSGTLELLGGSAVYRVE